MMDYLKEKVGMKGIRQMLTSSTTAKATARHLKRYSVSFQTL